MRKSSKLWLYQVVGGVVLLLSLLWVFATVSARMDDLQADLDLALADRATLLAQVETDVGIINGLLTSQAEERASLLANQEKLLRQIARLERLLRRAGVMVPTGGASGGGSGGGNSNGNGNPPSPPPPSPPPPCLVRHPITNVCLVEGG